MNRDAAFQARVVGNDAKPLSRQRLRLRRAAPLFGLAILALLRPSPAWSEEGEWTMPGKDYSSTRFSALEEITPENAKSLQVAFTFSPGVTRGQESAPIVSGATLYLVSAY